MLQNALENANVNANMIAPMLGHKPKNAVDFHYSDHLWQELLPKYKQALNYLLPVSVEKLKTETEEIKAKYEKLEDSFVEQLAEKQKETMQAVLKMLKGQGIKAEWEEERNKEP